MERSVPGLHEYFVALVLAVILAVFTRTFVAQAYRVPSPSMEPGLLAGDHILVNKFIYGYRIDGSSPPDFLPMRRVHRGDVVVFASPLDPGRDFIKRCVALPGEIITISASALEIDHQAFDESGYVFADSSARPSDAVLGPYLVPSDHVFCLGDHRQLSNDSRSWGPVPERRLKGRALIIYWSTAEWGAGEGETWDRMHTSGRGDTSWFLGFRWRRCLRLVR